MAADGNHGGDHQCERQELELAMPGKDDYDIKEEEEAVDRGGSIQSSSDSCAEQQRMTFHSFNKEGITRQRTFSNENEKPSSALDITPNTPSSAFSSPATFSRTKRCQMISFSAGVLAIGIFCATAFLGIGIHGLRNDAKLQFEKKTDQVVQAVQTTWREYETVALWIHQSVRFKQNYSSFAAERRQFEILYQYVQANGLDTELLAYVPNITHDFRDALEAESAAYYQQVYPALHYQGFTGMFYDPTAIPPVQLRPRPIHDFYFPQLLVQPLQPHNDLYIDLDVYSSSYSNLIDRALTENKPILSNFYWSTGSATKGRMVFMLHPGVPVSVHSASEQSQEPVPNHGLASIIFAFRPFMERVTLQYKVTDTAVYIYDDTDPTKPHLFGAVHCHQASSSDDDHNSGHDYQEETTVTLYDEQEMDLSWETLQATIPSNRIMHRRVRIAHQVWKIVVVSDEISLQDKASLAYLIIGGTLMVVACFFLVTWYLSKTIRDGQLEALQRSTQAEKAALIVQHAQATIDVERQRNDYLAHEVRNPLAAALSACSFLEGALMPLSSTPGWNPSNSATTSSSRPPDSDAVAMVPTSHTPQIREDVRVIKSSLTFINDLLLCMLDVNKIARQQITLHPSPTLLYRDIFEPIQCILFSRDNPLTIQLDCPSDLVICIDRTRLKQVVLNLANNAKRFMQCSGGFVRLRARSTETAVLISVEDSGPGIPREKQTELFSRFQASLEVLNQGTGMGLYLCHELVALMGGVLSLDESYSSGIDHCPGSRFVIELPIAVLLQRANDTVQSQSTPDLEEGIIPVENDRVCRATDIGELPKDLSVLLTDDDTILRKMLMRSIRRVAPTWKFWEAANGETALRMVEDRRFDLIFMDQYMASVDRQLLGTESVQVLRNRGISSRICGLSANDMREAFLLAGADHFLLKPFSIDPEQLKRDLQMALGVNLLG